jgi:hypothetical protein
METTMNEIIEQFISAFDDEEGLNEGVYEATKELICYHWGSASATVFSRYVDATDGRFYIAEDAIGDAIKDIKTANYF